MPTPFMHLHFAERLLAHPALDEAVRQQLCANWPAFYLGSVAPDFQVVCAVVREATHFYTIPVTAEDTAAFDRLLTTYPALATPNPTARTPSHLLGRLRGTFALRFALGPCRIDPSFSARGVGR